MAIGDFPIVFADSQPAEHIVKADFVGTDNHQSIASIVEYLCRTGAAPVFLSMPLVNSNAIERRDAYVSKMTELGFAPRFVDVAQVDDSWQFEAYGLGEMDAHFGRSDHIGDTILCANDRIVIGAIGAANKRGLFARTGDSAGGLRIAGHDDHPLSQFMYPATTTAAQDITGIGCDAVRLLLERVREERSDNPVVIRKEAMLQIRTST